MSGGDRRAVARAAAAIGIATGTYGISLGVLSVAAGLSVAQTCAMSLLVFTGASQFAAVGCSAPAARPRRPSRRRCSWRDATRSMDCRWCPCSVGA